MTIGGAGAFSEKYNGASGVIRSVRSYEGINEGLVGIYGMQGDRRHAVEELLVLCEENFKSGDLPVFFGAGLMVDAVRTLPENQRWEVAQQALNILKDQAEKRRLNYTLIDQFIFILLETVPPDQRDSLQASVLAWKRVRPEEPSASVSAEPKPELAA